jgi:hypothetical protein
MPRPASLFRLQLEGILNSGSCLVALASPEAHPFLLKGLRLERAIASIHRAAESPCSRKLRERALDFSS